MFHQRGANGVERVHLDGVVVGEGLLHHGVEFLDLLVEFLQLVVVVVQLFLRLRSHDFDGLRVVDVAHKAHVLVVGEERHRSAHSFHFQCIKDLRVVIGGGQDGHFIGDDGRVDGDWRVVDVLLQIDGLVVAVGQVHVDLELVVVLVASRQRDGHCKQENQIFFHFVYS